MSSLYLDHFGLTKPPFQITPDLDFFFSGGRRGDILTALLHVAAHDEGIITLVAEVGSGKTLLARLMISRLPSDVCVAYLANPCFSRDEIIVAIARDLGLASLQGSIEAKLAALQQELLRRHAAGQRVLLVIDEAHAMPAESLEEVRLLSNLETGQHKLVNIMLFGQPELDTLLAEPRLRQVKDRVIHRFELPPLQTSEVGAYIDHRLRAAGWQGAGLFTPNALSRLVKSSGGRARRINLLADKALLAAYAQNERQVDVRHVDDALRELPLDSFQVPSTSSSAWRIAGWSVAIATLLSAGVVGALGWHRGEGNATTNLTQPHRIGEPQAAAKPAERPLAPTVAPTTAAPVEVVAAAPAESIDKPADSVSVVPAEPMPVAPDTASPVLTPTDARTAAILARTERRLQAEKLDGYTIQLAALPGSTRPDRYMRQLIAQLDESQIFAKYSVYKGNTYMAVFYGQFDSFQGASSSVNQLPVALKANRPLVRTWIKIKEDQAP
jgi:MSHA biogenesis protein MshM